MLDLYNELPNLLKTLRDQRSQLEKIIQLEPMNEAQRIGIEECRRQLKSVVIILRQFSKEGYN